MLNSILKYIFQQIHSRNSNKLLYIISIIINTIRDIHIVKKSLFLFLFFFISCSEIRLIQEYDPVADNKMNSLQEKTTKFFIKLERSVHLPENKYEKYIDFYDDVKSDIHVLEVRTKAVDKSEIVQKQLTALLNQIKALEELHKKGFNTKEEILLTQSAIDDSYTAILKLQYALKNKRN